MNLYDFYKDGKYVETLTAKEISDITGYTSHTIRAAALSGCGIDERYTAVDIEDRPLNRSKDKELLKEFEIVGKLIRQKYRKR